MTAWRDRLRIGFLGLCLLAIAAGPMVPDSLAQNASQPLTKEAIEQIIRQYILDHPELITESLRLAQERRQAEERKRAAAVIDVRRDDLLREPASPIGGNPEGDVTVVEFFDYRCGYCKRVAPIVRQLQAEDLKVRIVYKELPILGEESRLAARAALAAHKQGKYLPFHEALMASNDPPTMGEILKIAAQVGLDPVRLQTEMGSPEIQAALRKNHDLAQALGIRGTPAFVIGSEMVPGALDLSKLKELVARVRVR